MRKAAEIGKNYKKYSPDELVRLRKDMTLPEKESVLVGLRDDILKTAQSATETGSSANRVIGTELKKNRIKALFDDEKAFKAFERDLRDELASAKTYNKIMGGSNTDVNLAEGGQLIDVFSTLSNALRKPTAVLADVVDAVQREAMGVNRQNAVVLAKAIMNPKQSIKILRQIENANKAQQRAVGGFLTKQLSLQAARLGGLQQ